MSEQPSIMPIIHVTSIEDPRLAVYRDIKKTNLTRWSSQFIAEGQKVVERLIESDLEVESLLLRDGKRNSLSDFIADTHEVFVVRDELASQLVGYNFHSGFLACGLRPAPLKVAQLCSTANRDLIVACSRITDPDNLGSILRTARAFGASAIILGPGSTDPYSRRTLRVSMGNAFFLPILESINLLADLNRLREQHNFEIWASAISPQAAPVDSLKRPDKCVILLGNEADGLSDAEIAAADRTVVIPMRIGVDSLNVSVAAGILLNQMTSRY